MYLSDLSDPFRKTLRGKKKSYTVYADFGGGSLDFWDGSEDMMVDL